MAKSVIVDIEVLPGTGEDAYAVVERAIGVIEASGLRYEVGPMGTTVEGDLDSCLEVAKAAHRACFVDGVERVVSIIKIGESRTGTTIDGLVSKFREGA